jgi:hypothetical protein
MKKLITTLGIGLCLITFTKNSNAQIGASVGLEIALPLEDGFGIGFGVTGGGEYSLDENMGITGQLGFIKLTAEGDGSYSMIPIQFGFKYYFDSNESGFYGHGQLGFHTFRASIEVPTYNFTTGAIGSETISSSNTEFSLAFGGGYMINTNIDLGIRYNMILLEGDNFNYLGLRAAYNF